MVDGVLGEVTVGNGDLPEVVGRGEWRWREGEDLMVFEN